jgi:hypothetical protein
MPVGRTVRGGCKASGINGFANTISEKTAQVI